MVILGLWDGHDSGAALIADGRVLAAVNEERLTRRKLEICFPARSIECCLALAAVSAADVDLVAASTGDVAKTLARWFPGLKERYYRIRRRKASPGYLSQLQKRAKYWIPEWGPTRVSRALSLAALRRELRRVGLGSVQVRLLDHHECHAASAAWSSSFPSCAVLTIDGVGDGLSSTISAFDGGRLTRVTESSAKDSLGIFFEHVTNLLNMRELEDEGKVMALADYAAPVPDDSNPLLSLFAVHEGRVTARVPGHAMMSHLQSIFWRFPSEQFARMAQRTVEAVSVRLAQDAVRLTGLRRLALAGGVMSNIKAGRRIGLLPDVENLYVFPHMGDGGLALGAALSAARSDDVLNGGLPDLGLGPHYADREIVSAFQRASLPSDKPTDLVCEVADLLGQGRIVCWFQGRMEYGPRALGYRSVLATPDSAEVRDRLNRVLKQRVWYQPFCPSMLASDASHLLEDHAGRSNVHMTMGYMVHPAYREALAGVTSIDGTCRPHIVADNAEGPFADLLRAVKVKRGLGVVLNTSYNIHGEPLVCTPGEAIDVYQRAGADALAMGPYLVKRGQ